MDETLSIHVFTNKLVFDLETLEIEIDDDNNPYSF